MSDAGIMQGEDQRTATDATPADEPARHLPAVTLITLVNDPDLHRCCLEAARAAARRAGIALQPIAVDCDRHGWNAARGLNAGLEAARHRWALCIHQDVMLPPRWFERAEASLARLLAEPGPPAVCGTVGVQASGRFLGGVRDPHGAFRWGRPPGRVMSLDEHLLLVDREAGLRFDARVPGFHCYGTDLAIRARLAGRDAAVLDAPVVHLSAGRLDASFDQAATWLLARWGAMFEAVIPTPALTIQRTTPGNAARRRGVATWRSVARRPRMVPWTLEARRARQQQEELQRVIEGLPDSTTRGLAGRAA